MKTQIIKEGETLLEVPELSSYRLPSGDYSPSLAPVFYNPHMELSRDFSVLAAQVFVGKRPNASVCDPLAGVGARGLRYAREVSGISEVVVNDRSRIAQEILKRNIELNKLKNVRVEGKDARILLFSERFDLVDLDPFGSPVPFIEAASFSLRNGMLMLTATDTAPLCGVAERACMRKYLARSLRVEYCRELGIRILVGYVVRRVAGFSISAVPIFVHATRHYFRAFLLVRRSRRETDEHLKEIGYVLHCPKCGEREVQKSLVPEITPCECGSRRLCAGPLWLGRLWDGEFVNQMLNELDSRSFRLKSEEFRILKTIASEAEGPPLFYSLHGICSRLRLSPPPMERVLRDLRESGYFASRTHFSPDGIRTNAPLREIEGRLS